MKLAGPEVWERWTALVSTVADQSDGNSACEASCHGRVIPERARERERGGGLCHGRVVCTTSIAKTMVMNIYVISFTLGIFFYSPPSFTHAAFGRR